MKYKEIVLKRGQLYEELWTIGITKVSIKYDIPYQKLKESLNKANIPYPSSSYWSYISLEMFDKALKIPLPDSDSDEVILMVCDRADSGKKHSTKIYEKVEKKSQNDNAKGSETDFGVAQTVEKNDSLEGCKSHTNLPDKGTEIPDKSKLSIMVDELDFLNESEKEKILSIASTITVSENQHYLSIVKEYKTKVEQWLKNPRVDPLASRKGRYKWSTPSDMPFLCDCLGPDSFSRVYKMMNVLYKAVISLGGAVSKDMSVNLLGERITFKISDSQKQVKHQLTEKEKQELERYGRLEQGYGSAGNRRIRKYDYVPTGKLTFSVCFAGNVVDSGDELIECKIGEILIYFVKATIGAREFRLECEEKKRLEEEKKQREEEQRKRYTHEKERVAALENEAADYEMACKIRNYIKGVAISCELTEEVKSWIEWASKKADWYDPSISAVDEILGKRDHTKPHKEETNIPPFWRYF